MIDGSKKYMTRDGRSVRILCTDAPGSWPVVGLIEGQQDGCVYRWTAEGLSTVHESYQSPNDLVPYDLGVNVPIDAKIIVNGTRRYWAGVKNGVPHMYPKGLTSWSAAGYATVEITSDFKILD